MGKLISASVLQKCRTLLESHVQFLILRWAAR